MGSNSNPTIKYIVEHSLNWFRKQTMVAIVCIQYYPWVMMSISTSIEKSPNLSFFFVWSFYNIR